MIRPLLSTLRSSGRRGALTTLLSLASLLTATPSAATSALSASDIAHELRAFRETASVLYIAAHPDDENTRLIAYLARERGYRTGYLSLTRGDGGQNLIGTELGPALGLIRTHELLAARRIDGGRQFFTRAIDFGFSKNVDETLRVWNRDAILSDIVRVIRTFRPDVLVTRFFPTPTPTHGQHTASAALALEAFKLANDPSAFRSELGHLAPWQPKRIVLNVPVWGRPAPEDALALDVGGFDPLTGQSYGEIAAVSRSQHSSQGMGTTGSRGTAFEYFQPLAGETFSTDIMDGVDSSWSRLPQGSSLQSAADALLAAFNPFNPSASLPALLDFRRRLAALSDDPLVSEKRTHLDRLILACAGLHVETTLGQAEVVPGEPLKLRHTAIARQPGSTSVRWVATRYPSLDREVAIDADLVANTVLARDSEQHLPSDTPPSQPYWLRAPGEIGTFSVEDPALIGLPINPPALPVEHVFEFSGQRLVAADEPVQIIRDPVRGEIRRPLTVIPPVSLRFIDHLALFAPSSSRSVSIEISATRPDLSGAAHLETPAGWSVSPSSQPFTLTRAGESTRLTFTVTAPAETTTATLTAAAEVSGHTFRHARQEIRYDHIPSLLLQPAATLKSSAFDVAVRAKNVGYIPGAGDLTVDALNRLGLSVTELSIADLTRERLATFDAVVLGIRAYNTRPELAPRLPELFAYAEAGGTVIAQYNTTGLQVRPLAPYALKLSNERVSDELAPATFLAPDHPALNAPNKITPADFDGWVQERGLYFPNEWAPEFTPILSFNDPGEPPRHGSLLIARHGKGWFVYTGLSFFRELPEGVPGAYRLFANLLSLGM